MLGDFAVTRDLPMMCPVQPDDLGRRVRITHITVAPETPCRSRQRAACNGLVA